MNRRQLILWTTIIFSGISQHLSGQVSVQDSLALVALHNSTDGANWTDNSNWLSGPVADWFGITVSEGRVTGIALRENNLIGTIPVEIGDLTELTLLDLYTNQLTDTIPSSIGNLINLTEINLHNNQLTGAIPAEFGNLTNLVEVYMRNNQLTGPIPAGIVNFSNLENLYLNGNQLTESIPVAIGNLVNLENLSLFGNQLTGSIPTSIGSLTNLLSLNLSNNQLTGPIPGEIENLILLTSLSVGRNQLDGVIPPGIGQLTNLTFLFLTSNDHSGVIPNEIGNLVNLQSLFLGDNAFTESIPATIDSLTQLRTLHLNSNQLSGKIPDELYELVNLQSLRLSSNQLADTISAAISNMASLYDLWLSGNQFYGALPPELGEMPNLQYLYVDKNELTDCPDLSADTALINLDMRYNRFTFEDIEPNLFVPTFNYSLQDSVGTGLDTVINQGESLTLAVDVGGTANQYQWTKDGIDITGAESPTYTISAAEVDDAGLYSCNITNTLATALTLHRRPILVIISGGTGITENSAALPQVFALYQNYPNPFNPSTVIKYDLPQAARISIKIYDLSGQEIKILVSEDQAAGQNRILWNGLDNQGQKVASGIYIYQFKTQSFSQAHKMILLR